MGNFVFYKFLGGLSLFLVGLGGDLELCILDYSNNLNIFWRKYKDDEWGRKVVYKFYFF